MLDGQRMAEELMAKIRFQGEPGLAVVLVGEDPASVLYTDKKRKACEKIGIRSFMYRLPEKTTEGELLVLIEKLNQDELVHGILVQLPLPEHVDTNNIINAIDPAKDVDGFHPLNLGKLMSGRPEMVACTPLGCMKLIESVTKVEGKDAVVVGASDIVGKPMFFLLLNRGATVTMCHEHTKDLAEHTRRADILVVATGVPHLIKKDMVKKGAVVIDVGINRLDGKLVGDVDFDAVKQVTKHITPVPGGVGPMTIACLMENTVKAYKR